ncbi:MAG TPA: glucose-6-phosphate dehydrogenase [Candidatus Dormibacteraeota bacterium]|nr:glucose-6-phosphate dehydrogenase [Candidatus Dormibacteraeota bacterium]
MTGTASGAGLASEARAAALDNPLSAGLRLERAAAPCAMVIFGASGDLTKRKLVPALYALHSEGLLPTGFTVVGAGRTPMGDADFRAAMRDAVSRYGRVAVRDGVWDTFQEGVRYAHVDFDAAGGFAQLRDTLDAVDAERGTAGNRVYYLSVPPSAIAPYARRLGDEGLARQPDGGFARLIVEKPFGRDRQSGRALNEELHQSFAEEQIYRIDHYLGKETVQNLLVFRFGNGIFEPLWNRQYIDHVQITVAESIGVEGRGGFYEEAGALRDIVQNHIMQLVSVVGMEAPANFGAETIRDEKVKFLRAVRPMHPDDALTATVRGQYTRGWMDGAEVAGYRDERGVDPQSLRETFVAMRLDVDNWRWAGTPFYLRTGKRLPRRATEIAIQFRRVPHSPFVGHRAMPGGAEVADGIDPNMLVLRIQPDEGITMRFNAKVPGQAQRIRGVNMDFLYGSAFLTESPEAYERLIRDCMLGDATLFAREDEVDEAWRICDAVLAGWRAHPPDPEAAPNYPAGSWGPQEAHDFMARDGRAWRRL